MHQARPSNTTCCAPFREFLQWRKGDAIILAEANVLPETDMEYFGSDGDRMHMMFNFPRQPEPVLLRWPPATCARSLRAMKVTKPRPATAQWGLFLRNHDELDLGRLTEEQRQTVFAKFGPDKDICSSTIAASGGGWRQCSAATDAGASWLTA